MGVLGAYQQADSESDKLLVLVEAFGSQKARLLKAALDKVVSVRPNKADSHGMEPDNDLLFFQKNKDVYDQKLIKNAENISTAKSDKIPPQVTAPRNFRETTLWNHVIKNPKDGEPLIGMNGDPRFPTSAGFQKMQAIARGNGKNDNAVIHYQYNSKTDKAYDVKIVSKEQVIK